MIVVRLLCIDQKVKLDLYVDLIEKNTNKYIIDTCLVMVTQQKGPKTLSTNILKFQCAPSVDHGHAAKGPHDSFSTNILKFQCAPSVDLFLEMARRKAFSISASSVSPLASHKRHSDKRCRLH